MSRVQTSNLPANNQFTKEEIDNFINLAAKLASKAVLTALMRVIEDGPKHGFNQNDATDLSAEVQALIPYSFSAPLAQNFTAGGKKFCLNICLSIVEKDYKTSVDVPDDPELINSVMTKYTFLRQTACAYWRQFCEEFKELFGRICEYRSDIDFTTLTIDSDNVTTMYFDPECPTRIGIFCFYVDENGRPFYKK